MCMPLISNSKLLIEECYQSSKNYKLDKHIFFSCEIKQADSYCFLLKCVMTEKSLLVDFSPYVSVA